MKRRHAKELLPVIQAFAEGKEIQVRGSHIGAWRTVEYPDWDFQCEYRIKPETFERWLVVNGRGRVVVAHEDKESADKSAIAYSESCQYPPYNVVHVREVEE